MPDILMVVHGMGDSEAEDGFAWAAVLYPDGEQFTRDNRRWIQLPDGHQIYLLEVYYEDLNEVMRAKYAGLWEKIDASNDAVKAGNDFFSDVVSNVLSDAAIDIAQTRFIEKYIQARELARALVGASGDPTEIPIGVLAHSLGTLIAYEGLHRAADVVSSFAMHPVNLVVCAPMWTPMLAVQDFLQRKRYLVSKGFTKPGRFNQATEETEPLITRCTAIYDVGDPFFLLQNGGADYKPGTNGKNLVDDFVQVGAKKIDPRKHLMQENYLTTAKSRNAVLAGLFT